MKKLLLMAGVLVLAACGGERQDAPPAETTGEMAPMTADTAMMHSDTAMARDTAH